MSINELNNNLANWTLGIIYLDMVNGVGTSTIEGVTSSSMAMAMNNQGNNYYVTRVVTATNTVTLYLNENINGIMTFILLLRK